MEQLKKWIEDSLKGEYEYEAYIESTEKLLVETSREKLGKPFQVKGGWPGHKSSKEF
jgi:hypothetical protein